MGKTWLEVALNGGLTKESQPHVPVDRVWAAVCVGLTGVIMAGLLGRHWVGKWKAWRFRRVTFAP